VVTGQKVMVQRSSGIRNVAELAGRKVLTVKGGTQGPNLLRSVPSAQVVTFESAQQAFLALRQGKGAGYVNDEGSLLADMGKLGAARDEFLILPQNLSVEPMAFGIRKGEHALKAMVDETLRSLEQSGAAEQLFLKWYGPGTRANFPRRTFRIESDQVAS
jgi:polar amino acid transport system substrate-binding protein